jgi:hypothetical protein
VHDAEQREQLSREKGTASDERLSDTQAYTVLVSELI